MYDYTTTRQVKVQATTYEAINSLDILQEKTEELFQGFDFIRTYINNQKLCNKY